MKGLGLRERKRLEEHLRERGLRMTPARAIVLEGFLEFEGHADVETLLERVRAKDPGIGQATVFRTVRLLEEAGLAGEVSREGGSRLFEATWNRHHHDHLRCEACGRVVEFSDQAVERAQDAVYRRLGFVSTGHRLELRGLCPLCAKGQGKAKGAER